MVRQLRAVAAIAIIAASCAVSEAIEITVHGGASLGTYQTTDRKMDYALTLCGDDGKGLCVKLTAIRGSADIPRTRAYLNKYLGENVRPRGKNKWAGTVTIQGYTGDGTLTLNPGKNFVMHGCIYIVVCQDFTLIPAR